MLISSISRLNSAAKYSTFIWAVFWITFTKITSSLLGTFTDFLNQLVVIHFITCHLLLFTFSCLPFSPPLSSAEFHNFCFISGSIINCIRVTVRHVQLNARIFWCSGTFHIRNVNSWNLRAIQRTSDSKLESLKDLLSVSYVCFHAFYSFTLEFYVWRWYMLSLKSFQVGWKCFSWKIFSLRFRSSFAINQFFYHIGFIKKIKIWQAENGFFLPCALEITMTNCRLVALNQRFLSYLTQQFTFP